MFARFCAAVAVAALTTSLSAQDDDIPALIGKLKSAKNLSTKLKMVEALAEHGEKAKAAFEPLAELFLDQNSVTVRPQVRKAMRDVSPGLYKIAEKMMDNKKGTSGVISNEFYTLIASN